MTARSSTASSHGGWWLAFAGLSLVPIAGFIILAVAGHDEPSARGRSSSLEKARDPQAATTPVDDQEPKPIEQGMTATTATSADPSEPVEDNPGSGQEPSLPDDETAGDPAVTALLDESARLSTRDPLRSRQLLRDALAIDPNNVTALERLSTKMLIDEDYAEARKLAERCRAAGSSECEEIEALTVEVDDDVGERLVEATRTCLANTPDNVVCLYGMLNYHLALGETNDAAVLAGRLTQAAPQSTETLLARGRVKATGRQYRDARQLFEWACEQGDETACFRFEALKAEGW